MKLDSRIIEGRKPLTCFDCEEAKQFIGQEGYFSDYHGHFKNLNRASQGCLKKVDKSGDDYPYLCEQYYRFFLPAEWVKEPEPKWRAFKDHAEYKEFLNDGIIESWVKIKDKIADKIYELMYVGGGDDKICLGGMMFSVSKLFMDFELFNEGTGEWQPFGVLAEGMKNETRQENN